MSLQYDFESPFDLTALSTVTQAQLMQFVLKLAPLGNIGGIIIMSGVSGAHPDVTNNPRFTRYVWIDSQIPTAPVIKLYAGEGGSDTAADWVQAGLTDGSVTADKIAQYAVSVLTTLGESRIALNQTSVADISKATYLLRVDVAGRYIEVVSATSVVNGVTLDPSKLSVSGATNGMVLQYNSTLGYAVWAAINFTASLTDNTIAYSKLLNGSAGEAGFILRAALTAPYAIELASNNETTSQLLAQRSVRINRLSDSGASAGDRLHFAGGDWARFTPFYGPSTSGGTTVPSPNGGGQLFAPHGLGVIPKIFKCFLVCTVDDINYTAADDDTVDALALQGRNDAGTELAGGVTVYADDTNVYANFYNGGGAAARYRLIDNTTFARSNITPASWDVYFYAQP